MTALPKKGDKVSWGTSQGKTEGVVEKIVTSTTKVKGHTAKATKGKAGGSGEKQQVGQAGSAQA